MRLPPAPVAGTGPVANPWAASDPMLRTVAPSSPGDLIGQNAAEPSTDVPSDDREATGRQKAGAHRHLMLPRHANRRFGLAAKRGIDILGAAVGLVVLSPLFGGVAIALLVSDGRPILFRQLRAGQSGRPFRIVKFRTMRRDADQMRSELRRSNEVAGDAAFKLTDDPRVTRLGRFLRRTSIDELPQLWNVLRGDMSLVGPRPHPFDDLAGYADWHFQRLAMKPGLTGAWQISARTDPDFDHWVRMDLKYIREWSPWLDIRIILATIPALLRREGR